MQYFIIIYEIISVIFKCLPVNELHNSLLRCSLCEDGYDIPKNILCQESFFYEDVLRVISKSFQNNL